MNSVLNNHELLTTVTGTMWIGPIQRHV